MADVNHSMLGRRQEINLQLTRLLDSSLLGFSLWFAHFLRSSLAPQFWPGLVEIPPIEELFWVMAVIVPFMPEVLEMRGFYANLYYKTTARSLRQLAEAIFIMGTVIGAMVVFLKWNVPSRSVVILALALSVTALILREKWQKERLRRRLASGKGRERVIVAGSAQDSENFEKQMTAEQCASIEVAARIDITQQPVSDLVAAMHQVSASRVIFAARHVHFGIIEEAVQACETEGVEAWIAADFFQTAIARPTFDVLGGRLMLVFHSTPPISWALTFKSWMDFLGAVALLLLTLPLWVLVAFGIKCSSKGPVFFRQIRSGHYGKPFRMWKFRTMHENAEEQRACLESMNEMSGPTFKIKDDPRVFSFGKWLRKTSIDELPQLLNVIRGEMSLVGPRPLPVYEVEKIEKHAQRRRLSMKPGLTCLWQISGRNNIKDFDEWVNMDLNYIDNWSLWIDIKILFKTIPVIFRCSGAS